MAQQRPEGTVQFYKEHGLDEKGNQLFKCEYCGQDSEPDFINDYIEMIHHLYNVHDKSEIMEDPKYQSVAARFNLHRQNVNQIDVGECLVSNCNMKIKSLFGAALPFKNHSITHHTDDNKSFFAKAVEIDFGQKILNNYIIEDTEYAKCSFCWTLIPLKGLDSHTAEVLTALNRHMITHIAKSNTLKEKISELLSLDEAFIQSELKKEEDMQLVVNKKKQDIYKEVSMQETLRNIETEDLNTLLQRYRMKLNKAKNIIVCEINSDHRLIYDVNKLYCIRNHWEIHHGPKNMIYNGTKNIASISKLLRNYKITDGTLAICSECEYLENLEKDNELYSEILLTIRHHWFHIHRKNLINSQFTKHADQVLLDKVEELKKKRREAATQVSHPAERLGQDIPSQDVPETPETPEIPETLESSEIRSTAMQSSSTVEYKPEQSSSSGDSVPEAQESSEIRNTTTQSSATVENMPKQSSDDDDIPVSGETQSPLTVEPSPKQIRLDSDTDVVE